MFPFPRGKRVSVPRLFRPRRTRTTRGRIPGIRGLLLLLVVVILLLLRGIRSNHQPGPPPIPPSFPNPQGTQNGLYLVERVVDGDTLRLIGGETVRLIGVDAPESVKPHHPVEPFGPEATRFLRNLIAEAGNKVHLEFDSPLRDKYGRLLAYVWVGDKLANEELIRAGLARAEMEYSYSLAMKQRFSRAEAEAKAAKRGIWSLAP